MAYLFLILVILGFWHFIYEGILLPGMRLRLRFRLHALRDNIRTLKIADPDFQDEPFDHLDGIVDGMLRVLPYLDVGLVGRMIREEAGNPRLRKAIEQRQQMISACSVRKVKQIYDELELIARYAVFANSFFFSICTLPFLLMQDFVKRSTAKLTLSPVNLFDRFASR